ncbi:cytochrome C [Sphingosinicella microcystinivorans]|uniref:cytochrome C n=1 Tax=Sphingosinicella microcystinivorans TaxID=335406 RepID=UPI0022F3BC7A|nr:cytochrome C [Sphingosinicella microcystinivorans]WBX84614.1 cytochrome C [Sphingosinicella microcystinivorans]
MIRWRVIATFLLAAVASASPAAPLPGVKNEGQTRQDWIMNCQGCHRSEGSGSGSGVPGLASNVSRFLHLQHGRAFLGRVPGVAFAPLSDQRVADLLNWVVQTYDPANMPRTFKPYTAAEVQALRKQPLITDSMTVRAQIMDEIEK